MMIRGLSISIGIKQLLISLCMLISLMVLASATAADDTAGGRIAAKTNGDGQQESPVIMNDSTIDAAINNYSLLVVDCWKEGCEPCQQISPKIDEMAQDFKEKITFGRLLTDQNHKTRVKYHVYHYPMLLIFKNGTLVYKHLGNYPKETLESIILSKLGLG